MRPESKCPTSNLTKSSSDATKFIQRGTTRSRPAGACDLYNYCPYYFLTSPKAMQVEGIPLVSWPLHLARIALLVFGVPDGDHVLGADCQVQKGPGFGGAAVNVTSLSIR